jgi:hypothetical protein
MPEFQVIGLQHFNFRQAASNIFISIIIEKNNEEAFKTNVLWFEKITVVNLLARYKIINVSKALY